MPDLALISDDQKYRYFLTRDLPNDFDEVCLFIMLNPSTADASINDPTIKRCMDFAASWEYGHLWVGNLFAYRSTDPEVLEGPVDAVGRQNDQWLLRMSQKADLIIAAWGNAGALRDRNLQVQKLIGVDKMRHLGLTQMYQPKHPLYLKKTTLPERF